MTKMRFSVAVAALASAVAVNAANFTVKVGANGLAFDPTSITAAAGDSISFQFQGKNHSVTQSTFGAPCTQQTTPTLGVDSKFQFVPANATTLPQWTITVNNASTPLWFFCAQKTPADHCAAGMVFAVNAPADKTFDMFQAKAKGLAANGTTAGTGTGTGTSAGTSPSPSATGSSAVKVGGTAAGMLSAAAIVFSLVL